MTVTNEAPPAPKRTAMQVALDAERVAAANGRQLAELSGELANISALAEAAAESGGSAPVGNVLAELRDKVGEFEDWRAGFLGVDGTKGVSAVAEQGSANAAALRELVKDLGKVWGLIPSNLLVDGNGGALATQQQVAEVDKRLREVEEWRAAELDEDNAGSEFALADRLFQLEAAVNGMHNRQLPVPGSPATPHVLGLIAQLQRRVHEISKGREFKAENNRGETTQRYSFRGIDEAQNAIGSAQREIGLIGPKVTIVEKAVSVTEVNKGSYTQVWTTVSVTARYTFQSPIDGSEWSTEGCGMGRDLGDKAESKALAGAFKYALFHGLNIPVKGVFIDAETEDPRIEQDNTDQREQRGYAQDRIERDAGRTYGGGQAPTDSDDPFGGAEPPARPPQDERSPAEQAHAALTAARKAPDTQTLANIWQRAQQLGILSMHVDGAQLGQHLIAALNTQPGGREVDLPGMEHYR